MLTLVLLKDNRIEFSRFSSVILVRIFYLLYEYFSSEKNCSHIYVLPKRQMIFLKMRVYLYIFLPPNKIYKNLSKRMLLNCDFCTKSA
jgi:hypothetical protein